MRERLRSRRAVFRGRTSESSCSVCDFRTGIGGCGALLDAREARVGRVPDAGGPLAGGAAAVVDYGCRDIHPSQRDSAGLRPLHHERVHDPRQGRTAHHMADHALLPTGRALHRPDHRSRLPEEGARRPPQPQGRAPVLGPHRERDRRSPCRCSCRARPSWTTATSTPTVSATSRRPRRSCPPPWRCSRPSRCGGCSTGTSRASTCTSARSGCTCGAAAFPPRPPELFDSRMEEVRSGHDEEPEEPPAATEGGSPVWDERLDELGDRYPRPWCRWPPLTASRSRCGCPSRWTAPRTACASAGPRWAFPGIPAWPA